MKIITIQPVYENPSLRVTKYNLKSENETKELESFIKLTIPKWYNTSLKSFHLSSDENCTSYVFRSKKWNNNQILAIFNVQWIKYPSDSPWINQILLYPLIDPEIFVKKSEIFTEIMNNGGINQLIEAHCRYENINFSSIGFTMLILPEKSFLKSFINSISNINWDTHLNLADYLGYDANSDKTLLNSTYHLINRNDQFNEDLSITKKMKTKMDGSITLFEQYLQNKNPFQLEKMGKSFQKLLDIKLYYEYLIPFFQKKLKHYKQSRKKIWAKYFIFSKFQFTPYLHRLCFAQNFNLFKKSGLRMRFFKTSSHQGQQVIEDYQYSILMCLFECLVSEGSSFPELTDDNGNLRSEIFNISILKKFMGEYFGILEFNIASKGNSPEWIFIGLSFVKRKNQTPHILSSTLLFPSWFRGYGFGQFLALIGMFQCENVGIGKKFEVLGTSRNVMTNRLVDKIGFFRYGYLPNMSFDITGHKTDLSYSVGMNRTFKLTTKALTQLSTDDFNNKLKRKIKRAYKINQKTFKYFQDELIKKKKISPLILAPY
ncbi:hypothetical protein NEF87_004820 [Candidatus Lokiarchaeum ossiferum]|uniref:N-acetyltransferase domain-containing protein n=1 Tax=Candidatus Lokiarchaeum ossiferum TaxID=2951803 RepID=A0ABY6HYC3_9ARCH|nr:hypothetical protein NEF87_004820 [Candidatus Lokiarchaeum sp. B-35]